MKKGFTLIELLAVIVILAIIAIIAVPIVLNVIETAKKGAIKDSAYGVLSSAEVYVASNLKDGIKSNIKFNCSGNNCTDGHDAISFKGKIESGTLVIATDGKTLVCVDDGKYYALKGASDKDVSAGEGTCGSYEEANGSFNIVNITEEQIKELQTELDLYKKSYNSEIVWKYSYLGEPQLFKAPTSGTYKVELWGAQGYEYSSSYTGGRGSYTSGEIELDKDQILYIYVGGAGLQATYSHTNGGWNGGGGGLKRVQNYCFQGGGGGATDIRLVNGNWDDFDSLKSRIMVAAGGGSSTYADTNNKWVGNGGPGGGLTGYDGYTVGYSTSYYGKGATQTAGGASIYNSSPTGYGQFGKGMMVAATTDAYTGAGGGYYGGGATNQCCGCSGGGGSSFISGHDGCDAITSTSTSTSISHSGQSIHYSGLKFTNTKMIDGKGYEWTTAIGSTVVGMPTYDGKSTMNGNEGNGYAKITYLGK